MNWYLVIKFLHILSVTLTIGGMFARQLVREFAKSNQDVNVVLIVAALMVLKPF